MSDLSTKITFAGVTAEARLFASAGIRLFSDGTNWTVDTHSYGTDRLYADLTRARIESGADDERAIVHYLATREDRASRAAQAEATHRLAKSLTELAHGHMHMDHTVEIGLSRAIRAALAEAN